MNCEIGTAVAKCSGMIRNILSRISIMPLDKLLPFEWSTDENEAKFSKWIESDLIHHPVRITPIDNENYLVLDQNGIYYRAVHSELENIPVLICDHKELNIVSGHLGLVNFDRHDLIRLAEKHPDQIILNEKLKSHNEQYLLFKFSFIDDSTQKVYLRNSTQTGCPFPMELIFRSVLENGRVVPFFERKQKSDSLTRIQNITSFVELPGFSLLDLKNGAQSERYFPPDVINIQSQLRVFNIDYPLSILSSDISIDEKRAFLREMVNLREQSQKTAYYQGKIYLLNS